MFTVWIVHVAIIWNNVADTTDRLAEQAQVREEPDEHHRPARHPPLLRQHRPRQLDGRRTAHGGPENRAVLQDHEDSQVGLRNFIQINTSELSMPVPQ